MNLFVFCTITHLFQLDISIILFEDVLGLLLQLMMERLSLLSNSVTYALAKKYYSLELHVIEVIAKNIGVSPMQLLSFILDEVNSGHITKEDGLTVIDHFVRRFLA